MFRMPCDNVLYSAEGVIWRNEYTRHKVDLAWIEWEADGISTATTFDQKDQGSLKGQPQVAEVSEWSWS